MLSSFLCCFEAAVDCTISCAQLISERGNYLLYTHVYCNTPFNSGAQTPKARVYSYYMYLYSNKYKFTRVLVRRGEDVGTLYYVQPEVFYLQ